jgi:K+:H+ antiporter
MPHDTPLISTIVAGLVLAFIFGALANRIKMPPLVGYLAAGIVAGPFTPGFVANTELASELSEIGVILLMFGVGLNFSLKDLLSVQAVAVPGALLRIAGGTLMGMGLAWSMGWPLGGGLIFGLALSVASTVVLLKALQDRHLIESDRGRVAVGWVIVEDIAMVLALVLIPAFSGLLGGTAAVVHDPFVDLVQRLSGISLNVWGIVAVTVVKLAAFIGFMLVVGRRVIPWILHLTAHTGSRELFRLAVLAIALGVAAGSAYLFGVSLALGAFFAGMILSESELSNRAAQESLPFRDAFAVLFFVSVGMLFNPSILWTHPFEVMGTLFIILIGKTVLGFLLVIAFRRPASSALTIAASLAQIGEFSFILAALGVGLGLMPPEGQSYILAGAILSIIVNPILMFAAEHLRPRLELPAPDAGKTLPAAASEAPLDERHPTSLTGHVVLIGYGRVGSVVAEGLHRQGAQFLVVEDAEARIAAAHAAGIEIVVGNAASGKALALANIAGARALLVAIPNAFEAGQAVEQAHKLNPGLQIVARAHADEEITYLRDLGATQVIMGEREIGLGMLEWIDGGPPVAAGVTLPIPVPVPSPPPLAARAARIEPSLGGAAGLAAAPVAPDVVMALEAVGGMASSAALPPQPVRPKTPPRRRPVAPASTAATPFNAGPPAADEEP